MKFGLILSLVSIYVLCESKRVPGFAPYIDITRETDLVGLKQKFGVKAFHLAFALGGTGGCNPMWGGSIAIDDPTIIDPIKALKEAGGDVIVSTGGALNPYLETSCGSVEALVGAYKKALAATGSTHLDIDIESNVPLDTMNKALAALQQGNPAITVSFTLMVQDDETGVTDALGLELLKNAAKNGVNVDLVNPMTMEFWSRQTDWGSAVIAAANATHTQMKTVWPGKSDQELYSMLSVTPMIGHNYNGRVFDQTHAKRLVNWAKQNHIGHLSFWSIGRDKGCPGGGISPDCSGIAQDDHEFSKIFVEFDSDIPITEPTVGPVHSTTTGPVHVTTKGPVHSTTTGPVHVTTQGPLDCTVDGKKYPDMTDCSKFYWCFGGKAHIESCGPGTIWDTKRGLCNYPEQVDRPECKK